MDIKSFVLGQASAGGGGGDITVESLSASENKTYTAPTGKAYSPVVVNVPGPTLQTKSATPTTSAQDVEPDSGYDGLSKVAVDAIPSQYIIPTGTKSVTENGTGIDVAQYAAVDVAVPSSGGSSWTKVATAEVEDTYAGTTGAALTTIDLSATPWTGQALLFVSVRDKAGEVNGKYFGTDTVGFWGGPNSSPVYMGCVYRGYAGNPYGNESYGSSSAYGIYPQSYNSSTKVLNIFHRYKSGTTGTIDGTYVIEVYKLDYAPGGNPFS